MTQGTPKVTLGWQTHSVRATLAGITACVVVPPLVWVAVLVGTRQIDFEMELLMQDRCRRITNGGCMLSRRVNVTAPLIVPVSLGPFLDWEEFLNRFNLSVGRRLHACPISLDMRLFRDANQHLTSFTSALHLIRQSRMN